MDIFITTPEDCPFRQLHRTANYHICGALKNRQSDAACMDWVDFPSYCPVGIGKIVRVLPGELVRKS